jgi:signal transduction histidine kinase
MTDLLQLYEQAPTLPEAGDLRQTLVPMLEGLSRALGYRRALVALYDQQRGALRGSIGLNVPESIAEALEVPLAESDDPLVRALVTGAPQRVDDVKADTRMREHNRALLLELDMGSFIVAPLRHGLSSAGDERTMPPVIWQGQELPSMAVVLLSKDERITDQDIDRLMPFATQAGVALARASNVEMLRSSAEQYAIEKEWLWWMLTAVDDPVVLTDAQNDIIYQNVRAEQIFRARPDDSEGKRHAISMNNFLFTAALSTWSLEQAGNRTGRDLTLVDPIEGTELLFEALNYPSTNYVTGERGMVSVLKNVSQLRQAAEQIQENVQRLQSADEEIRLERDRLNLILSSVPNPILVVDNDNQIIRMNEQAQRLLPPVSSNTPMVMPVSRRDQIAAANGAKLTSFLAQLRIEYAQVKSGELALIHPDSEETLEMWVTASEIRDRWGVVTAVAAVLQNLAPLRELERRRVEQALFQSEKLAATGRLAASIAHEINNPLEAIKNSLYILVNKVDPNDPNYKFLDIAKRETERVSRILSQLLGFYRPTATMRPTDINGLVEEAEGLVEKHLRQRNVRLVNEMSPDLPAVVASGDQLKQVVLNLLLNAQDAMPEGGQIFVSTHVSHEADPAFLLSESVHIVIRDTGKGIEEEHMPHIFEPFFSTKSEAKGTGLGLWVSFGIVRNHGGNIRVRSRPGKGTTFTISLPIGGPPADATPEG